MKPLRSLLAFIALCLLPHQASAMVARPGVGLGPVPLAPVQAHGIPAGYRNVNHCGLVKMSPVAETPRHALRTPYLYSAPLPNAGALALQNRPENLKQRLTTAQGSWGPVHTAYTSHFVRTPLRGNRTGWSHAWSIRPPPSQSL